jgi:hypothetical protein
MLITLFMLQTEKLLKKQRFSLYGMCNPVSLFVFQFLAVMEKLWGKQPILCLGWSQLHQCYSVYLHDHIITHGIFLQSLNKFLHQWRMSKWYHEQDRCWMFCSESSPETHIFGLGNKMSNTKLRRKRNKFPGICTW